MCEIAVGDIVDLIILDVECESYSHDQKKRLDLKGKMFRRNSTYTGVEGALK